MYCPLLNLYQPCLSVLQAAQGLWEQAAANYRRASQLAPEFSFAAANYALVGGWVGGD